MNGESRKIDNADEASLVEACRKGDFTAFESLVQRHQRMLFNIAFRLTGLQEDAADIVQDTFLAAWRKIGAFRGEARISTWLTAICVNLTRNRLQQVQSRHRREAYSLDAPLPGSEMLPELPGAGPTALEEMEEAELRSALHGCIDALSAEFREVLVLRDMQELSYQEVGQMLQVREGTVKSRLFRAREAIRDCLKRAMRT